MKDERNTPIRKLATASATRGMQVAQALSIITEHSRGAPTAVMLAVTAATAALHHLANDMVKLGHLAIEADERKPANPAPVIGIAAAQGFTITAEVDLEGDVAILAINDDEGDGLFEAKPVSLVLPVPLSTEHGQLLLRLSHGMEAAHVEAMRNGGSDLDHSGNDTDEFQNALVRLACTLCPVPVPTASGLIEVAIEKLDEADKTRAAMQREIVELRQVVRQNLADYKVSMDAANARFDMVRHLARQISWSEKTFGPNARTKGLVDHITKELREIESEPYDLSEWVDIIILGIDGAWRALSNDPENIGERPTALFCADAIVSALASKQAKNEKRSWPDWKAAGDDVAIEHNRGSHD